MSSGTGDGPGTGSGDPGTSDADAAAANAAAAAAGVTAAGVTAAAAANSGVNGMASQMGMQGTTSPANNAMSVLGLSNSTGDPGIGGGSTTAADSGFHGMNVSIGSNSGATGGAGSTAGTASSTGQSTGSTGQSNAGTGQPGDDGAAAAGQAVGTALGHSTSAGGGIGAALGNRGDFHGNSTMSNVGATNLGKQLSIYAQNLNDPAVTKLINRINAQPSTTKISLIQNMLGANADTVAPHVVADLNAKLTSLVQSVAHPGYAHSTSATAPAQTGQQSINPAIAQQLSQKLAMTQGPPSGQFGYPGVGQSAGPPGGTSAPGGQMGGSAPAPSGPSPATTQGPPSMFGQNVHPAVAQQLATLNPAQQQAVLQHAQNPGSPLGGTHIGQQALANQQWRSRF